MRIVFGFTSDYYMCYQCQTTSQSPEYILIHTIDRHYDFSSSLTIREKIFMIEQDERLFMNLYILNRKYGE